MKVGDVVRVRQDTRGSVAIVRGMVGVAHEVHGDWTAVRFFLLKGSWALHAPTELVNLTAIGGAQ